MFLARPLFVQSVFGYSDILPAAVDSLSRIVNVPPVRLRGALKRWPLVHTRLSSRVNTHRRGCTAALSPFLAEILHLGTHTDNRHIFDGQLDVRCKRKSDSSHEELTESQVSLSEIFDIGRFGNYA